LKQIKEEVGALEIDLKFEIGFDQERKVNFASLVSVIHGNRRESALNLALIESPEYEELKKSDQALGGIGKGPFEVWTDDRKRATVQTPEELLKNVLEASKSGMSVQRYKGLGEMNPEQLWETTMDPTRRTLLRVTVQDAVDADSVFSVLMGDQVEPRRQFIEENALRVRNLDV
jgi:DNA gyrase subunit B